MWTLHFRYFNLTYKISGEGSQQRNETIHLQDFISRWVCPQVHVDICTNMSLRRPVLTAINKQWMRGLEECAISNNF